MVTKKSAKLISVWIPNKMEAAILEAIQREDSDRSKFIRNAIRNRIRNHGIEVKEA